MIKSLISGIVSIYQQAISPFLGSRCRFYPSCSEYARLCVEKFSLPRGIWLTLKRLARCHPLCEGGFDPVP